MKGFVKSYPTPAARRMALRRFEAARARRAAKDLEQRDEMIRAALQLDDNAAELAEAIGVARTYVYRIRDKKPGRKTE